MTQLLITSEPSGAEVMIDGEPAGTTPVTISIDEDGLAEFRAECLSGGSVVCSWDVLKTRLEDHIVSRLWWDLTRDERYSIAEQAIKNTMFFHIDYITRSYSGGLPNCEGSDGAVWIDAACTSNGVIRYLKFGQSDFTLIDSCYWKKDSDSPENCHVPDHSYNLPTYMVEGVSETVPNYGHTMCAILIDEQLESLDNLVVFQYLAFDIKPGHQQMPCESVMSVGKSSFFSCGGYSLVDRVEFCT